VNDNISKEQQESDCGIVNVSGNNPPSDGSTNSCELRNQDSVDHQVHSKVRVVDNDLLQEETSQHNMSDHNCDDIDDLTNVDGLYIETPSDSSKPHKEQTTRRKGRGGRIAKAKRKLNSEMSNNSSDRNFSVIEKSQNLNARPSYINEHSSIGMHESLNTVREHEQLTDIPENDSSNEIPESGELQHAGDMIGNRENLFTPISEGSGSRDGFDISCLPIDMQNYESENDIIDNTMTVDKVTCKRLLPHKRFGDTVTTLSEQAAKTQDLQVYDFNVEASKTSPFPLSINIRQKKRKSRKKMDLKGPKLHKTSSIGDVFSVDVGTALRAFFKVHDKVKGIHLNKGKRDIKKKLVVLKRQKDAVDKLTWSRSHHTLDRNRLDDSFEMTEDGRKKKEEIDRKNARDEYVVNWYMWCPGHGNCERKCGGIGTCKEGMHILFIYLSMYWYI